MGTPMVARCSFGSIQRSSANAAPPETGRLKLRLFLAPREHPMLPRSCWCCCLSLSGGGGSSKNILPPLKRVGNHTETSGKLAVFDLLPGREVADDFFEVLALLQPKLLSTCDKFKLYFFWQNMRSPKSLVRLALLGWIGFLWCNDSRFPPLRKLEPLGMPATVKPEPWGFPERREGWIQPLKNSHFEPKNGCFGLMFLLFQGDHIFWFLPFVFGLDKLETFGANLEQRFLLQISGISMGIRGFRDGDTQVVHSWKLTCPLKNTGQNTTFLLKWPLLEN